MTANRNPLITTPSNKPPCIGGFSILKPMEQLQYIHTKKNALHLPNSKDELTLHLDFPFLEGLELKRYTSNLPRKHKDAIGWKVVKYQGKYALQCSFLNNRTLNDSPAEKSLNCVLRVNKRSSASPATSTFINCSFQFSLSFQSQSKRFTLSNLTVHIYHSEGTTEWRVGGSTMIPMELPGVEGIVGTIEENYPLFRPNRTRVMGFYLTDDGPTLKGVFI